MEEIVTGEAVILDLPYARFPTRLLALLLDLLVEGVTLVVLWALAWVGATTGTLDNASGAAVIVAESVLVIVGYPAVCETLSRGRSVGKLALGLRVVADDGGPERFRQALVRALAGAIECWALIGVPALITSMLSARGKRLGDIFAGTFVVRERAPKAAVPYAALSGARPAAYIHPGLRPWAASLDLSALPDWLAASAASYLSRFGQLNEAPREEIGRQLAVSVAARVPPRPPAGLSPADYLHTVLAERRNRELARLMPPASDSPPSGSAPWPAPAQAEPGQEPWVPPPAAAAYPAPGQDTAFPPPA